MDAGTINPDFGLPFVLGVTGHRDPLPKAISELSEQIRKLLAQLRADYPATRLMLLSPLAVGADRLVAQEFLAMPEDARAGLVAVLPCRRICLSRIFRRLSELNSSKCWRRRSR
jgi:hypothetical protein